MPPDTYATGQALQALHLVGSGLGFVPGEPGEKAGVIRCVILMPDGTEMA